MPQTIEQHRVYMPKWNKKHRLSVKQTQKIIAEIRKCVVVCANCHADRTYKQGRKAQKEKQL